MLKYLNYISREEDIEKFDSLIKKINNNNCVAFIGSGVSVNKGYRLWKNLIYDRMDEGSPIGLLEFAEISKEDIKHCVNYSQTMDYCKSKMNPADYNSFIKNEYARKLSEISENHSLICKTNYQHILTTNFDPCLYDNAESLIPKLITYRANPLEINSQRTLFHLHGRAYSTPNETEMFLDNLIDRLIFGKDSFEYAYSGFELSPFLYRAIQKYKLVFIGYSMNDEVFNNSIIAIKGAYEKFIEDFTKMHNLPVVEPFIGYIFLEYPSEAIAKLSSSIKLDIKETENLKKQIEHFASEEKRMTDMNLKVIGYDKKDDKYSGLTAILQLIKNKAGLSSLLKPYEAPDAAISASLTGSII
ncbi:MAG TPA: SIR2 family protein [Ignavibacteriaceae bacterium]|nr:SIR2 family protein [Ignavibacteriaceae bacterium]